MTPTQKYLESINAPHEIREWVGDRTLQEAWDTCDRLDCLQFVAKASAVDAYAAARASAVDAYAAAVSPARAEYNAARASAQAAYDAARASARDCKTSDELREKFTCPEVK